MVTQIIKLGNNGNTYVPITLTEAVQHSWTGETGVLLSSYLGTLKDRVETAVTTLTSAELTNGHAISYDSTNGLIIMDRQGTTTSNVKIDGSSKIKVSYDAGLLIEHTTIGAAGSYGPTSDGSIGTSSTTGGTSTFKVPYITTDSTGHVTAAERTITLTLPDLSAISGLEGAMHFIGFATADLTDGQTTDPTVTGHSGSFVAGDVVAYGTKEYIKDDNNTWHLLGEDISIKANKSLTLTSNSENPITFNSTHSTTLDNATINISHSEVQRTDGRQDSPTSNQVTVVDAVTSNSYGHITGTTYTNALKNISLAEMSGSDDQGCVVDINLGNNPGEITYLRADLTVNDSAVADKYVSYVKQSPTGKIEIGRADLPKATVTAIDDDNTYISVSENNGTWTVNHVTAPGTYHIPAGGREDDILAYSKNGEARWTNISTSTTSVTTGLQYSVSNMTATNIDDSLFVPAFGGSWTPVDNTTVVTEVSVN